MTKTPARVRGFPLLVACLVLSPAALCGCSREAEQLAREAEQRAREAEASLRLQMEEARAAAERKVRESEATLLLRVDQARAEAEHRAEGWQPYLLRAVLEAKAEMDKVHKTTTEYDLVISTPEEGSDRLKAHEARLAKMDRVQVQDITIGYEQRDDRSLAGTAYERHFRATWVKDGRVIGVSYYSKKEVDAAAFVGLLGRLVPVVNEYVSRNVTVKRGG